MSDNSIIVITGASRGFGKAVALACVKQFNNACYILTSSQLEGVNATRDEMRKIKKDAQISTVACEWSIGGNAINRNAEKLCDKVYNFEKCEGRAYLICNHATLGELNWFEDLNVIAGNIDYYMNINFTSVLAITQEFMKFASQRAKNVTLVNLSSLCAVKPFQNYHLYCAGKAARDMLYKTIGKEADVRKTGVRTLNYSPGGMSSTDMGKQTRTETKDDDLRNMFKQMAAEGKGVDVNESAMKLLTILADDTYENGEHVSFYTYGVPAEDKKVPV